MTSKSFLAGLLFSAALAGAGVASPAPADPVSLTHAFTHGKFSANLRLRYEGVNQTGLRDADALTLRTRIGYITAPWQGWKLMVEAEDITAADGSRYSQAGLNPGGAGRAVVADPETTEVNQTWLAYAGGQTTATLGRQRLVLDNARFVGDVAWRQNMQTFDAFTLASRALPKTTLTYAYLDRINRVFGREHPQGGWQSDSHLFHASYSGFAAGTLTAYTYLMDFPHAAAANSNATSGVSFAGRRKLSDELAFTYRTELAQQRGHGSSPLAYRTRYYALEAGLEAKAGSLGFGSELLGSDHNIGFKTPLATLHAFNGWADLFLATPAAGLRDTYVKATANLPGKLILLAFHHRFDADRGSTRYGTELDGQLTRSFGRNFTAALKYADFSRASAAYPSVRKVWFQVEFIH